MPLSLNALLGIPTRDEKFTAARDQKMQDFNKELLGERERIRREGDKYDWEEGSNRITSTLVGAGYAPEAAQKLVAQHLSSPAMAGATKFSTLEGIKPFAAEMGSSEAERSIEENKAAKEGAINLGAVDRAIRPFVTTSTTGGELLKEKQRAAEMEQANLLREQARDARMTRAQTSGLETEAERARLEAAPLLANQNVKLGETTLVGSDLQNKIATERLAEAQRINKQQSTLAPALAAAEAQMPGELAQTKILEAQQFRKYIQEHPEVVSTLIGGTRPFDPNRAGAVDWRSQVPGGSVYSPKSPIFDPESARLISIILGQPQ